MPITLEEAQEEARREVVLTDAWTPLRSHRMQSLLAYHPAQFKWCPAGRRSGKTMTAKRHSVTDLITVADNGLPHRILIGAPTYTRVKEIYFEDLRALIPKHWIKKIKESTHELEFRTHWDAYIRLVGMNNPKVVEGVPWTRAKFDELADYPPNTFEKHIALAFGTEGLNASAWMIGVPDEAGDNQAEYEKYWKIGLKYDGVEFKTHCSFWWPATDILSPEKAAEYKATMDPIRFKEEVLGHFVRSGNKAFPSFNSDVHVSDFYTEYSPNLAIDFSLDFGVRPACSIIGQHYGQQMWVMDEIELEDGSTDVAAAAFIERCRQRGYKLHRGVNVFGDAAGRNPGSNTGESDYKILRDVFESRGVRATFHRRRLSNPLRKDTVNAIRLKFSDTNGKVTLWINPRCKGLLEDIDKAPWPSDLKAFHRLAGLRYYTYELYGDGPDSGVTGIGTATFSENEKLSARYTRDR